MNILWIDATALDQPGAVVTVPASARRPAPGRTRLNRGSEAVRTRLVEAAIAVFAADGFEGASTRDIAARADAHQSQITYHFASKEDLWRQAMEHLLQSLDARTAAHLATVERSDARARFEATIRGLVEFAAERPELNRIMIHEATASGPRLEWLVVTHLRRRQAALTRQWQELLERGVARPISPDVVYHTLVGAASLLYANAPEAELMGIDPGDPEVVASHADALVAMFLRPA